jgi:uncharacterized protein (TIGR00369 family)
MEGKKVKDSAVMLSQIMTPQDVNQAGNVHGGVIMKLVDTAGGLVAKRHARSNVVTASIDRLDFYHPVYVGDVVTLKASLNMVGSTSMEVGVRVETEDPMTGETRHVVSAYLTYVSLDAQRKPGLVPPLILESEVEERRNREAQSRRDIRLRGRRK